MIFFNSADRRSKSLSSLLIHPSVFNHEENLGAYLHIQGQAKCMCTVTVGCQDSVSTEVDKRSQEDIWSECDSTLHHRHKPGLKICVSFCAMASIVCWFHCSIIWIHSGVFLNVLKICFGRLTRTLILSSSPKAESAGSTHILNLVPVELKLSHNWSKAHAKLLSCNHSSSKKTTYITILTKLLTDDASFLLNEEIMLPFAASPCRSSELKHELIITCSRHVDQ